MNITRENVKDATGLVSSFGAGALTGMATSRYIMMMPNPVMRVAAFVASLGIGIRVGSFAKQGTDELIDSVCFVVDEVKKRN